jgi:hypothetical protein
MEFSYGEFPLVKSFLFISGGFLLIYIGSKLELFYVSIGLAIFGGSLAGTGTLHLFPSPILLRINSPDWVASIYWLFWLCVTLAIYSNEKLKKISDDC